MRKNIRNKRIKRLNILAFAMATTMLLTACGGNANVSKDKDTTVAETTQSKNDVTLAAGFDEEFEIAMDEELYIGSPDVSIKLNRIFYDEEYLMTDISYTLTVKGEEYEGTGNWLEEMGGSIDQGVYTTNRVKFIRADKDSSATLIITSDTVAKEPIALSGKADEEYITTEPEYVVADKFILFIDENMKIFGNTVEIITSIMEAVENETGLKFENGSEFSVLRSDELVKLYGQDVFAGVDPYKEKFHVYVTSADKWVTSSGMYSIVLNQEDLDFPAGEGMGIVHELTHAVQTANGASMGTIMDEGFATYIAGQITKKDEILDFNFDADDNYSGYNVKITKDNAEEEFLKEYDDSWNYYLYGYRFVTFLYEEYGNKVFLDIFAEATNNLEEYKTVLATEEVVPIIKEKTSAKVFEEFAEWLNKNQGRFE